MGAEQDARGQFAKSQGDRHATGVASAKPTVITGQEDVMGKTAPPGQKEPTKDWDINFEIGAGDTNDASKSGS